MIALFDMTIIVMQKKRVEKLMWTCLKHGRPIGSKDKNS